MYGCPEAASFTRQLIDLTWKSPLKGGNAESQFLGRPYRELRGNDMNEIFMIQQKWHLEELAGYETDRIIHKYIHTYIHMQMHKRTHIVIQSLVCHTHRRPQTPCTGSLK